MNFGENLKRIRKLRNISQEDLAVKLNISRQSVSKWETGENYPSMTNIMCLCDIFKCNINEIVHEDLSDIDSLDEEIRMNVVKFKEQEQKNMKGISKTIYIIAKILKVCAYILLVCSIMALTVSTIVVPNTKINTDKEEIKLFNNSFEYEISDKELYIIENDNDKHKVASFEENEIEQVEEILEQPKIKIFTAALLISVSILVLSIFLIKLFKILEKLFKNIHDLDTPFSLENVEYIKKIAIYVLIIVIICDLPLAFINILLINKVNVTLNLTNYFICLIIFALSYIFKYGYEIQLDSKGKIYGKEE